MPPHLEGGAPLAPGWSPRSLAARVDDLGLVVCAQAYALGKPLDAGAWAELEARRKAALAG